MKTGIYKHFKGGTVFVYGTSQYSEDDETVVLYLGMQDKKHHARPLSSFEATVEKDGSSVKRFSLVQEISFNLDKNIETAIDNNKNF